jgi:hypothetical protein
MTMIGGVFGGGAGTEGPEGETPPSPPEHEAIKNPMKTNNNNRE